MTSAKVFSIILRLVRSVHQIIETDDVNEATDVSVTFAGTAKVAFLCNILARRPFTYFFFNIQRVSNYI